MLRLVPTAVSAPVAERRAAPRRQGRAPVRLVSSPASEPVEAVALDLGPRGVLICDSPGLRVGESVVVAITLDGHDEIVCQGDVVRIDAQGCSGLALRHLRPSETDALERYAASL